MFKILLYIYYIIRDGYYNSDYKKNNNIQKKVFTKKYVNLHNTVNDCWVIIDEKIYDLTNFMKNHSGGYYQS